MWERLRFPAARMRGFLLGVLGMEGRGRRGGLFLSGESSVLRLGKRVGGWRGVRGYSIWAVKNHCICDCAVVFSFLKGFRRCEKLYIGGIMRNEFGGRRWEGRSDMFEGGVIRWLSGTTSIKKSGSSGAGSERLRHGWLKR